MSPVKTPLNLGTLAKASPAGLLRLADGERFQYPSHLRLLNDALLDVAAGLCLRLLVTLPPRHGKSNMISRAFPAWIVARLRRDVILASYEADFAGVWGERARELIRDHGSIYGVELSTSRSARNSWEITGGGSMTTTGVGGPLTGRGGDLLVIDDPVKNAEQANSQVYRDKTWEWYASTAYTRLEPGGAVVLLQTRWHEDDLAGRILTGADESGEVWRVLNLAALSEDGLEDPLNRPSGTALWPERYPVDRLDTIRRTIGSYWWSALYQQRPAPLEGAFFKSGQFRYFDERLEGGRAIYVLHTPDGDVIVPDAEIWKFSIVDLAVTTGAQSDYFVISTWGVTKKRDMLLLDVLRTKAEGPDQPGLIRKIWNEYRPAYIGIERVGYQMTLVQQMRREGLPIRELRAETDKMSRALSVATRYEAGMIYHKRTVSWLADWEYELLHFPYGAHDDQVDTASYAGIEVTRGRMIGPAPKPDGW
jgi:predicted phage terminase large subunit-like protein